MLVIGEAGVGKSRLVAAAAASVAPDVVVVSGWCLPFSESVPFLPIADVLRALDNVDNGRLVTAALDHCPPFVRGEMLRLTPGRQEGRTRDAVSWLRRGVASNDCSRRCTACSVRLRSFSAPRS